MESKKICITHKKMTDQEVYEELKILHKREPDIFMNPDEWKEEQNISLKKQGLTWSR